jgi:GTPase Era involved in 16S rRNA processing
VCVTVVGLADNRRGSGQRSLVRVSEQEVAVTRPDAALARALDELASLVDARDTAAVEELRRRLTGQVLRVLVVGEAKRGKSTLVNALLGRPVLPMGVVPLTAVTTVVTYGDHEHAEVAFTGGRRERVDLEEVGAYVTERGNPDNTRGVDAVTVYVDAPLLAGGVELVDTPGTGSVLEHQTVEANAALDAMDAAIFVLTVDPPVSSSERAWLREVRDQAVRVFCVLNKADYLTDADLMEALRFTHDVVTGELGDDVDVWPVSARAALEGAGQTSVTDERWRAFADVFTRYLGTEAGRDLTVSIATRGAVLARAAADEASATLAALSLSERDLDERVEQFRARLEAIDASRFEASALADATFRKLLGDTAEQAQQLAKTAAPGVVAAVAEHLDGLDGPLGDVEAAALAYAAERIREVVDTWRTRRTDELADELGRLDAQLRQRVEEHVRAVRDAAAALFPLSLPSLPPAGELVEPRRFRYAFGPDVGQTEALAAAVRTHLPGRAGRSRVSRYLRDRTLVLLDRQIGRARADFTERLRETQRQLRRAVDERFDTGAGRIAAAVQTAAARRRDTRADTAALRDAAERRQATAEALAATFDQLIQLPPMESATA